MPVRAPTQETNVRGDCIYENTRVDSIIFDVIKKEIDI